MINLFDPNCVILLSKIPRPWDWCRGGSDRKRKWDYRRIRLKRLREKKRKQRELFADIKPIPFFSAPEAGSFRGHMSGHVYMADMGGER